MREIILVLLIGYLIGCLQWSYILAKTIKKVDIRTLGGGNAGASNTVTSLGWKWGILVAVLDISKAILSIYIIKYLFTTPLLEENYIYLYINGFAVILGHNFPFFMGFKGGKGTASLIGMIFAINLLLGLFGFLTIVLVTIFTDFVAVGTLSLVLFFIFGTIFLKFNIYCIIISIIIALISFYLHIPNYKRILKKEESGLRKALSKNKR